MKMEFFKSDNNEILQSEPLKPGPILSAPYISPGPGFYSAILPGPVSNPPLLVSPNTCRPFLPSGLGSVSPLFPGPSGFTTPQTTSSNQNLVNIYPAIDADLHV